MYSIQHASPLSFSALISRNQHFFKDSYARTILQQQFHYPPPTRLHNRCAISALFRYVKPNIPFASAQKKAPKFLLKLNAFFLRCTHFPQKLFPRVSMGISFDGKTFKKRSGSTQRKLLLELHRLHFPGYWESFYCCWSWRCISAVIEQRFNSIFAHLNDDERGAEISFNSTSSLVKWNLIPFDCWSCKCQRFLTFFSAFLRNVLNSTFRANKRNFTQKRCF